MSQMVAILRKDLLIEWRGKSRLIGLCCYALTFLLLFSFAVGPDSVALRRHAAAYVWLSVLCVSTLLLVQSFRIETEEGALEGLLLVPVSPAALFYGKALANTLSLSRWGCSPCRLRRFSLTSRLPDPGAVCLQSWCWVQRDLQLLAPSIPR